MEIEPLSPKTPISEHATKDFGWKQPPWTTERASELPVRIFLIVTLVNNESGVGTTTEQQHSTAKVNNEGNDEINKAVNLERDMNERNFVR